MAMRALSAPPASRTPTSTTATSTAPTSTAAQEERHLRPYRAPDTAARPPSAGALADIDTSTPAVVLKFDANVMHHGGLGVIRSLGRRGVPVYGVHEGPWAPVARSRYLRGRYYWQPPGDDPGRVTEGLRRLADRIGRRSVLLATDDAGAIFLAEHGDDLRDAYSFPSPPPGLPRRLAGKHSLAELCGDLGVASPRSVVSRSVLDARAFAEAVGFPLVAKLATPWRHGKGLKSTSIVADRDGLDALQRAADDEASELLLQEYLPGGPGDDWFVHAYANEASLCTPLFTGVKERAYPAHAGLTSFGTSRRNERLGAEMAALVARVGYRGILDLDVRYDRRDGQYKLLDFNPRLGAQFRLFRDTAGVDVALAQYLDLTGQPIPPGEPLGDRHFVVESYDALGAFSYWRSGELSLRSWAGSLLQVDETAWFAADDLRPFGLMCVRMGVRLATRPLERHHAHALSPKANSTKANSPEADPARRGPVLRFRGALAR